MSFDIHNYFTDNFMTVKGDKAEEFLNSFQHVVEEASFLKVPEINQIKYNFRYHGAPKHKYLFEAEQKFPDLNFELKGYFYPNELDLGFTKILIYSNKKLILCDSLKEETNFKFEKRFILDFFIKLSCIFVIKWWITSKENITNHSHGPNVYFFLICISS